MKRRDRHGRGLRGPVALGPDEARRPPVAHPGRAAQRFDRHVARSAERIEQKRGRELGLLEYAVEDVPSVPDNWPDEAPLSSLTRGSATSAARIVVFRRPIEARCASPRELRLLIHAQLVVQVAELLGVHPLDVDPSIADSLEDPSAE